MSGKLKRIKMLEKAYNGCKKCPLHASRTKLVHWKGSPDAKLFVIGEAPGAEEDIAGIPFVGPAGRKLDEAVRVAGVDLAENLFVTNTVACRPSGNRNPARGEIRECSKRLHMLLGIVKPKAVLMLGGVAAKMMGISSVGQWRGTITDWEVLMDFSDNKRVVRYPAMCSWHPSYILRQGGSIELFNALVSDIKAIWKVANATR